MQWRARMPFCDLTQKITTFQCLVHSTVECAPVAVHILHAAAQLIIAYICASTSPRTSLRDTLSEYRRE